MRHWQRMFVAVGLGAVFALGQPPFDLWWLALVALAAIFVVVAGDVPPKQTGWIGWSFGAGYFTVSLHWIVEPFQVDAATTGWMAPFALIGIGAGLAIFWGFAFWIGRRLSHGTLLIAVCLAAAEMVRSYALTGFPWGLIGYLWAPTAMAQWHAWIGPHGLTLMTLLICSLIAESVRTRKVLRAMAVLSLGVLAFVGAFWSIPEMPDDLDRPVVRLIQPNAPQHQKWDPAHIPTFFQRQVDFTAQLPNPDLIVWPETAVPNLLRHADEALDVIAQAAAGTPVVLGIQRDENGRYFNSLVTLDAAGLLDQIYDKHHLVPFGEYMPLASVFARFNIFGLAARAETGYASGPGPQLIDLGALGKALPLICYEAVFPQDVNAAPERPDVLLQITNDAWFGNFAGPQQHLQQARLRAIEQGLPMIRVANTGISAVIDPYGRVVDSLPLGRAGFLDVAVPAPVAPTLYSRTHDWPALILIIVLFAARLVGNRKTRH